MSALPSVLVGVGGAAAGRVLAGSAPATPGLPALPSAPDPAVTSAAAEEIASVRNAERAIAQTRKPPTLLTDPNAVQPAPAERKQLLGE